MAVGRLSDARVVQSNPDSGVTTYFHYDDAAGAFTLEDRQDAEPVIELNKLQANELTGGWKKDLHHVARIPLVVMEQLRRDGILQDKTRFRAWLNGRDNRLFRTKPGHI